MNAACGSTPQTRRKKSKVLERWEMKQGDHVELRRLALNSSDDSESYNKP